MRQAAGTVRCRAVLAESSQLVSARLLVLGRVLAPHGLVRLVLDRSSGLDWIVSVVVRPNAVAVPVMLRVSVVLVMPGLLVMPSLLVMPIIGALLVSQRRGIVRAMIRLGVVGRWAVCGAGEGLGCVVMVVPDLAVSCDVQAGAELHAQHPNQHGEHGEGRVP